MVTYHELTWKPHIEYIYVTAKILKFTGFYKLRWELSYTVMKMLYFSLIYSHETRKLVT